MKKNKGALLENTVGVGERLRIFRESVGKGRTSLAKEMKLPIIQVIAVENGKKYPSIPFLLFLKENYHLDINWLLTGVPFGALKDDHVDVMPPQQAIAIYKKHQVTVKNNYEELFKLLLVPEVAQVIFVELPRVKEKFGKDYENLVKAGKIKEINV